MRDSNVTDAKRRLVDLLKRGGAMSAPDMARRLAMTHVAVRQHLTALEQAGLVEPTPRAADGRGRPGFVWSLTTEGHSLFPDRHGELTLGLIKAIRSSLGEETLHRIVEVRAADQAKTYRAVLPGQHASLKKRVEALAAQRTGEGYMAEVVQKKPGLYYLIEHHCPICDAATACQLLCRAELELFQNVLGEDVVVTRSSHLLSDGDRCAYRIERRAHDSMSS